VCRMRSVIPSAHDIRRVPIGYPALRPRRRERSDVDRASRRANSCQQAFSQGYHRLPFHVQFSLQAGEVTIDRRYGEDAAAALVFSRQSLAAMSPSIAISSHFSA